MEDNNQQKKNRFQLFYSQLRTSFFSIMFELLKEKNTSLFLGCFIILVTFIQLMGHLFEPNEFEWRDQFFLNFIIQLCNYCRIIKAINSAGSPFFYWLLMIFGYLYLLTIIGLLLYMNYFLKNRKYYTENVVRVLRYMILLMYWVFYMPFYEVFISILKCNSDGNHYLDTSIACYQGLHIFYIVLCIIFLIILFSISLIIAMLFNETQPMQEDCLSRIESSFEVALVIYRSTVATFSIFCDSDICSWILISKFIISSSMLCYQYFKQIPYYNSFVSNFFGSLIFTYCWVSINALLMKLLVVNGHIVIIFAGIPLICLLVQSLRQRRIQSLIKRNIDKVQIDIDALIQVHNMTDFSNGINRDQTHRMTMIGIINIHVLECQNAECPCKDEYELFDVTTNQFSERNVQAPHLDEVFLNHFIKRLYEDSLNKFINSPNIHIAFSFYLFKVMKNIHSSLIELNIAQKKKPSLQQQFTIFRYKNIIEEYIQQDHVDHKHVYPELSNVIEFERLFGEMQRAIEKVCNLQVEFWTHLTTVVPDLNILNDLGKKVYEAGEESELYWNQLCKINPNYQQALSIYGEYLKDIRNHEHLGNAYIERAFNQMSNKKNIDEHAKSSDILFSEDTTVIHVSGNKESVGKILKTSQGLSKVFGYSKTEVIGHSINILMPTLFARKHTDFLERFFKTGRQIIFYHERILFATHRNGHCFPMKILVKQMPNLIEGIQYVGMIKPILADVEYMLTDMDGVIDSFSKGITGLLGLTPNLFKDKDTQINIQLLAPDLIAFFMETQRRNGKAAKSKFRDIGGEQLMLIVPRDFHMIAKSEAKQNPRSGGGGRNRGKNQASNFRNRSPLFRTFLKCLSKPKKIPRDKMPTAQQLLAQREYQDCERKREVICEITPLDMKCSSSDSLKMLVFKFTNNANRDKAGKEGAYGIPQDLMGGGNNYIQGNGENGFDYCKQQTDSSKALDEEEPPNEHPDYLNTARTAGSNLGYAESGYSLGQHGSHSQMQGTDPNVAQFDQYKQNTLPQASQFSKASPNQQTLPKPSSLMQPESNLVESDLASNAAPSEKKAKKSIKFKDVPAEPDSPVQQKKVGGVASGAIKASDEAHKEEDNEGSENSSGGLRTEEEPEDNNQQKSPIEEPKGFDDAINMSEIETPRMDVSGLKLDSAQKEKTSFLQELKKQSFLLSEDSTQKMDVKDSVNVSAIKLQEQAKNDGSSSKRGEKKSSQGLNVQQDAEKMVKKENFQNLISKKFMGDDQEGIIEAEDEDEGSRVDIQERKDANEEVSQQDVEEEQDDNNLNAGRIETQKDSNQAGKTDQSFEEDKEGSGQPDEPSAAASKNHLHPNSRQKTNAAGSGPRNYEAQLHDSDEEERQARRKKMRQNTRFQKAMKSDPSEDEDEDEDSKNDDDEEEQQDNADDDDIITESEIEEETEGGVNVRSTGKNSKKTGSVASSRKPEDRVPLLGSGEGSTFRPANFGGNADAPNMNEIKHGFDDDQVSDDDENGYYQNGGENSSNESPPPKLKGMSTRRGGPEAHKPTSTKQKAPTTQKKSQYQLPDVKKRDTNKIKTNGKYRCIDDGSGGDDDEDMQKNEDYQALSSKELDFRETILKFERKKRRRDRKIKEREQKRIKALNGDENSASLATGEPSGSTAGGASGEDEDETHSKSSVVSSSDSDTNEGLDADEAGNNHSSGKGQNIPKPDADGVSSVTSRQNKTERNHYILRTAIDEKYIPNSIKNLRLAANFIFLVLLLLSIIYYVIQISLFDLINQNIKNIHNSESRLNYIIDITLRTRTLILINNDYLNLNASEKDLLINITLSELRTSATELKIAQTDLSLKTASLSNEQLEQINPADVRMKYLKYPNMPDLYVFSIWEAIMEIVVSAYRISTMSLKDITDNHSTIFFVMQNSLNSVLKALRSSTDAIINESNNNRESNMNVFLYLLIAASCSLFFSILFLIPVINKVKKNKQEVLELFTHRTIEKHIDDQLKVCRNFISMRLQQTNDAGGGEHDIDGEDPNKNGAAGGDKELQNELNNNKYMKRIKKKNKGKKWKPLNSDFGATLLKFLLFITVIEGYFLANYLLSSKFLGEVQDLTQELKLLISRQPVQSFLLLIQKEMIYSNGTALIQGVKSEEYVPQYHELLYDEEEQLLDKFSSNFDYHSTAYNDDFNNLVYSNLCQHVTDFASDPKIQAECEVFNQGILKKGIYSSVIKYWDFLRQLNHDFMESNRQLPVIKQFLNEPRLKVAERMQDYYFKRSLSKLVMKLEEDIDYFFNYQYIQNRTIFIIYIIYIVGLYYFIWRRFVSILQNELWKTKSMLSILPTKLCFEIEEIRYFIYAHSSNDFISSKI